MRQYVNYFLLLIATTGCVSMAKFHAAQNNLENERQSNKITAKQLDSLSNRYFALQSDFNTLDYQLSESEKYASFTDYDLVKALQYYRAESERLSYDLKSAKKESAFYGWISEKRAEAFEENASCHMKSFGNKKYILQKGNMVYIDTEGLMMLTKGDPQAFKNLFVQLVEPIQKQRNWKMNLCLNVTDPTTDWKRLTLQNEMMSIFATEAQLPAENLASITRLVPQQRSAEFGYFTQSRLLVEIEFLAS